ncbi:MAG: prepilin-type N-terminal cleavage/methylation domain-containing protein [Thermodesulfovibrionaceae bacterium]
MKDKGYTLIEILISLLIFGLIVGVVSYAVSQGLNQYKGVIQKTSHFWEKSKIFWLNKSFASIIDYYVEVRRLVSFF